jgi:hypothetical protein
MWVKRGRLAAELERLREAVQEDATLTDLVAVWTAPPPPEDPRLQEMEREHQRRVHEAKEHEQERLTVGSGYGTSAIKRRFCHVTGP